MDAKAGDMDMDGNANPGTSSNTGTGANAKADQDFFRRLYNGEFSLARTFWLYNIVFTFLIALVGSLIVGLFAPGAIATILDIALGLFLLFYGVHCYMGIWRSASRYKGLALWAWLAKIYAVLGFVMVVANLILMAGQFLFA